MTDIAENSHVPSRHFHVVSVSWLLTGIAACCICLLAGCGETDEAAVDNSPPVMKEVSGTPEPLPLTAAELRSELKANNNARFQKVGGEIVEAHLINSGVKDIAPLAGLNLRTLDLGMLNISDISVLKGMPLKQLWLEGTQVADISPLAGMQLTDLYMQNTKVTDLNVLQGMPIRMLNLMGTQIEDISVVANMPLNTLWIPETNVSDLSALADIRLTSLDVRGSKVTDLTSVGKIKTLKRLNIVDCEITDLTPLADLSLDRILFTPAKITAGLDAIRNMRSLHSIGTDGINVNSTLEPAKFWAALDEGGFGTATPDDQDAANDTDSKPNAGEKKNDMPPQKPADKDESESSTGKPEETSTDPGAQSDAAPSDKKTESDNGVENTSPPETDDDESENKPPAAEENESSNETPAKDPKPEPPQSP